MKFVEFFISTEQTKKTKEKKNYLKQYLEEAPVSEVIFALHALTKGKKEKAASSRDMKRAANTLVTIPKWLFKKSYGEVGDLSETISLLVGKQEHKGDSIKDWYSYLNRLQRAKKYQKHIILRQFYQDHSKTEILLFNKLITGTFRIGVAKKTVITVLSDHLNIDETVLKRRLFSSWNPYKTSIETLSQDPNEEELRHTPYPFYLAENLEKDKENPKEYWFEWKYDGIRVQIIIDKIVSVWSRRGDLITNVFPECKSLKEHYPDGTILDAELLAYNKKPLPFTELQKRLGKNKATQKLQKEIPVKLFAYDVIQWKHEDIRNQPIEKRKQNLKETSILQPVKTFQFSTWEEAQQKKQKATQHGVEGLILKKKKSVYKEGRVRGNWWKWKRNPFTLDLVLLYAEKGRGRRAGKYTAYTFGVYKDQELVPLTRAYSGLTDKEIEEVDEWIKSNTVSSYGPVVEVVEEKVFEIAFQSISKKPSKKAGYTVRFPRIKRVRDTLSVEQADTVEECDNLFKTLQDQTANI